MHPIVQSAIVAIVVVLIANKTQMGRNLLGPA